jgi:HK97 gp10 family phage protein
MANGNSNFRLEVTRDLLAGLSGRAEERLRQVVQKTAFDVQAGAISDAPVDTGHLKNSIQPPQMVGRLTAVIRVGADYGIYVEMGTIHTAAQPYMTPALERARQPFIQAVTRALEDAASG